jgi:hypothetical protein
MIETPEWIIIAAAGGLALGMIIALIFVKVFKRKPKHDLHNLKKLVYDTGMKTREVYENIKELEKFFKEIENADR